MVFSWIMVKDEWLSHEENAFMCSSVSIIINTFFFFHKDLRYSLGSFCLWETFPMLLMPCKIESQYPH